MLYRLDPRYPELFPDPLSTAGDGPACFGGDLKPRRLLAAYQLGYFPWFSEGEPILWWHPDPRFVLFPEQLRVSKSMRPYFNQAKYHVKYDTRFGEVMERCKNTFRPGQFGSWITKDLKKGFLALHEAGFAHSVEVYEGKELVGGLYGLAIGKIFFGESMFHLRPNASKFGFITLVRDLQASGYRLLDCQQPTDHLRSLGGREIPREEFVEHVGMIQEERILRGKWV